MGNPTDTIAPTRGYFVFYLQESNHGGVRELHAIQCHNDGYRMWSIWSLFFGSRRCVLDNRCVVEGETWRIQGTICVKDALESLQVYSLIREWKFGDCFNFSHYFSSVGGQASTQMKPTEPTDISEKWGIGLEAARCTLECKTQRGLRTVLHPSLSRFF